MGRSKWIISIALVALAVAAPAAWVSRRHQGPAPFLARPDDPGSIVARYTAMAAALEDEDFRLAADAIASLWRDMADEPSVRAIREDLLQPAVQEVCTKYPLARAPVVLLRDAAATRLAGPGATRADVDEWIALNEALDERRSTLTLFDSQKNLSPATRAALLGSRGVPRVLYEEHRWEDLAGLYADPPQTVRAWSLQAALSLAGARLHSAADPHGVLVRTSQDYFCGRVAGVYVALLAVAREGDAEAVAGELAKSVGRTMARLALARAALDAGQVRPVHLAWMDAEPGDEARELARRLERMLRLDDEFPALSDQTIAEMNMEEARQAYSARQMALRRLDDYGPGPPDRIAAETTKLYAHLIELMGPAGR